MFIDKETRLRVNIHYAYKGFSKLDTPEKREAAGVIEIDEPETPEEVLANPDHFNRAEQDTAPYVTWPKRSEEAILRLDQEKTNLKSLAYLNETDWMVTRLSEIGTEIPVYILAARQKARDSIVKLEPNLPV